MLRIGSKLWRTYEWTPYTVTGETTGCWIVRRDDQSDGRNHRAPKDLKGGWMTRREWERWKASGPAKVTRKVAELLGGGVGTNG